MKWKSMFVTEIHFVKSRHLVGSRLIKWVISSYHIFLHLYIPYLWRKVLVYTQTQQRKRKSSDNSPSTFFHAVWAITVNRFPLIAAYLCASLYMILSNVLSRPSSPLTTFSLPLNNKKEIVERRWSGFASE